MINSPTESVGLILYIHGTFSSIISQDCINHRIDVSDIHLIVPIHVDAPPIKIVDRFVPKNYVKQEIHIGDTHLAVAVHIWGYYWDKRSLLDKCTVLIITRDSNSPL